MDPYTYYIMNQDTGLGGLGTYGTPGIAGPAEPEDDYLGRLEAEYQAILDEEPYEQPIVEPPDFDREGLARAGLGDALLMAGSGLLGAGIGNYTQALGAAGLGFQRGLEQGMQRERSLRQSEYQAELDRVRQETQARLATEKQATRRQGALKGLASIAEAKSEKEARKIAKDQFQESLIDLAQEDPDLAADLQMIYETDPDKAAEVLAARAKARFKDPKSPSYQRFNAGDTHYGVFNPETGQVVYRQHPDFITQSREPMTPEEAKDWIDDLKEESSALAVQEMEGQPADPGPGVIARQAQQIMIGKILDSPELYAGIEPYLSAQEKFLLNQERARRAGQVLPTPTSNDQASLHAGMDALLEEQEDQLAEE